MTNKPAASTRRTADARRETIIAAAHSLFAQHGFHGTGMAEIARRSQVLVGQIYRDFACKEALIKAIVERDVSALMDQADLARSIPAGRTDQLSTWLHRFIGRTLDLETRNVLADILSEATRNPAIAAILAHAHDRLRSQLIIAAMVWAPEPEQEGARQELADLILTAAGAIQHRQIFGLASSETMVIKLVELVEAEIAKLGSAKQLCHRQA